MHNATPVRYQAKWVFPVESDPIENGIVEVAGGLVQSVLKSHGNQSTTDLGEVALIPGLVNAHTHLEFSNLPEPLGTRGIEITDWIRLVIRNRTENSVQSKLAAIRAGINELIKAGVVAIGEIATAPISLADYDHNVNLTVHMEQLGRDESQIELKINAVKEFLGQSHSSNLQTAISPHAPYSLHPRLFEQLVAMAAKYQKPIAIHLAETQAERQLLDDQTGNFVSLLQELNAWDPTSFHPRMTILEYLKRLIQADRVLIVHGNYLDDSEIAFVGQHRSTLSVVYCPRTHEYFGHAAYPLQNLLDAGVDVAVGTDSRASNPDLNLFAELKTIARRHPEVSPSRILEMGTIRGAKCLNLGQCFGSLMPGKSAQMNVVSSSRIGSDGIQSLFDDEAICKPAG